MLCPLDIRRSTTATDYQIMYGYFGDSTLAMPRTRDRNKHAISRSGVNFESK